MRSNVESIRRGATLAKPLMSLASFLLSVAVGTVSSFTYSAAYDMARSAFSAKPVEVSGVWRGYWHGVPAASIKLEERDGALSGTVIFTAVVETEEGPRASGESPELPLINTRFDGKRLVFELHGMDEIRPTVFIEMEMTFEDEKTAELRCTRRDSVDVPKDEVPTIKMERESSF